MEESPTSTSAITESKSQSNILTNWNNSTRTKSSLALWKKLEGRDRVWLVFDRNYRDNFRQLWNDVLDARYFRCYIDDQLESVRIILYKTSVLQVTPLAYSNGCAISAQHRQQI